MKRKGIAVRKTITGLALFSVAIFGVSGCADGVGPKSREVNMPAPILANERKPAVNENADAILYLPLGEDVLMPQTEASAALPSQIIGPFELRDETLGGALQLIL
ncbi:MAG: type II and III secretion system family protein, partial [Pseudomonadota bacterium]